MQTRSDAYIAGMAREVRRPSHMRITLDTSTPIYYTDDDIISFTEQKTAHPIAGELPTITVALKIDNTDGKYNPDSPIGLYEELLSTVKMTYEFGFTIDSDSEINRYGYDAEGEETIDNTYGMSDDEDEAYGYLTGDPTIEWIAGGEVYTTGEISYDKMSATINAKDYLSFLTDTSDKRHNELTWGEIAQYYIDDSDYPEDTLGLKKIIIDSSLDTYSTNSNFSDLSISNILQSVAHAGCTQFYIDRSGYLRLDNDPESGDSSQYHLTLSEQLENGTFDKKKTAGTVTIEINTDSTSIPDVQGTLVEGGEDVTISNNFIETTPEAEALYARTKTYLTTRNTAEIPYRGEPALDILDKILLDTQYSTDLVATVTGTSLTYDGALTGTLTLLYSSTVTDNTSVTITGAENFIYTDGSTTCLPTSVILTCVSDATTPTYQWSYYTTSTGWVDLTLETNSTLTVLPTGVYFIGNNITIFKCTVNGKSSSVRMQRVQEITETTSTKYLGVLSALPTAYEKGNYFLCSPSFDAYSLGNVYIYDGSNWVLTVSNDLIVSVAKDAILLNLPLSNTSAVNAYLRSIIPHTLTLSSSTNTFNLYSDGTPYDGGQSATIIAYRKNIEEGIEWKINDVVQTSNTSDTITVTDTNLDSGKITIIATSSETGTIATLTINAITDRVPTSSNLGGVDSIPTENLQGEPITIGDYFLWIGETTETTPIYTKGQIYEYNGTTWVLNDTNGDLVMTMFDSFAKIANDVDSSIMGNAIIKKLVAIDAFIENLKAQNLQVGTGTGLASSGFRFRAQTDSVGDGTDIPIFDIYKDDKQLFKAETSGDNEGDIILGNYDETTKKGGIKYDYSEDKMLGNVAYDQWDLVVESDADLALLTTGTTTYKKVLITEGTWAVTTKIDLDAHDVEVFAGVGQSSIIDINFVIGAGNEAIKIAYVTGIFKELKIISSATQTQSTGIVINCGYSPTCYFSNVTIYDFDDFCVGFANGFECSFLTCVVVGCFIGFNYCYTLINCDVDAVAVGYENCGKLTNCTAQSVDGYGFSTCHELSSCQGSSNASSGFYACEYLSSCRGNSNLSSAFSGCNYISSSIANNSITGFSYCKNIVSSHAKNGTTGIINCTYISATYSSGNTTNWGTGNTKICSDSCNNV